MSLLIKHIKRAAALLLALVLLLTAGLYLVANQAAVAAFSHSLLEPVFNAVRGRPVYAPDGTVLVTALSNRPGNATGTQNTAARAEPAELDFAALPLFPFSNLLDVIPQDCLQVIYVLSQGSGGNVWLAEKSGGTWYTVAGPLYCAVGEGGLTAEKTDIDTKTPLGWFSPGKLYCGGQVSALWPQVGLGSGDIWVTDAASLYYNMLVKSGWNVTVQGHLPLDGGTRLDLGHNAACIPGRGAGVFIMSGDTSSPSGGSIVLGDGDMQRITRWLDPAKAPLAGVFSAVYAGWTVQNGMPEGFVRLTEAVPGALEDARYAGSDNFMGKPIAGYLGKRVIVSLPVAEALRKAQTMLEEQGFGLLVYDSYRPQRAVADIFNWLRDDSSPGLKEAYYPDLKKSELPGRYLAEYSPHRRGIAVDLTVVSLETGQPLDMGTPFDFFSPASWYASRLISVQQGENRKLLRDVMTACGFEPYDREWWHFNLISGKTNKTVYDFVIPQ